MAESPGTPGEKPTPVPEAPGDGSRAASLPQKMSEGSNNKVPRPRRDAAFRRELLKKLPQLTHAGWSIKENFKIDEEWGSVLSLRADPLLESLEKIAPERLHS